ncbi:MAG TPA: phospho-N-acetylmuramoyl-pentapeptide-transferase [Spirochaetota bacterium]|nr:phospho-N-acetylmuramoyl-pentapeptide-transferase [Spirochaetota bacterium]HNT12088.1 phospho-N-acetylmuramoyl-pentapeptide-transferase [Spirochaetota bacterium]
MFYHFILPLQEYLSFLRLFQYISFRSAYAALTALVIVLIFGAIVIAWLRRLRFKEEIRSDGPQSHKAKAGTPTMGGVIILGAVLISIFLWGNFNSEYLILLTVATLVLGSLGFADDYIKSIRKRKGGVPGKLKLVVQLATAGGVVAGMLVFPANPEALTQIYVPFVNEPLVTLSRVAIGGIALDMTWAWVIFAMIVVVGSSNAVNLTDGLDGLAVGTVLFVAASLAVMCYLSGHVKIASYLKIPYIPDGAELTVFLSALCGASLGFLWFNSNPATVFMGDTGSLALGGVIGIVAIMIKKEIFLFIVGGVFVVEAMSVIIQVLSFKLTGKRVFKMAPIHHHFELSGWTEQKVVVRFWILGIILAILGLSSLKIL